MQTYNMPHRKLKRRQEALERRKKNLAEYGKDMAGKQDKYDRAKADVANLEAKLKGSA